MRQNVYFSIFNRAFYTGGFCLLAAALIACGRQGAPSFLAAGVGIVHGKVVKAAEPLKGSVVAIVIQSDEGEALCTGSLIAEDAVLTAAHCVDHDPSKMVIVFAQKIKGVKDNRIRLADGFTQHPLWAKKSNANGLNINSAGKGERGDLAVIHFSGGLPEGAVPVNLADSKTKINKGDAILVMGYGVTNGDKQIGEGSLREATTNLIGAVSKTEIATDGEKSSVCFGDSGGPAFIQNGDAWLQIGVASAVTNQSCNQASVHTDVRSYRTWIKSTTAALNEKSIK